MAEGALVHQGEEIYAVDNQPRVLFFGTTPAYRDLSEDSDPGVDIYELEENLVALGYDPDHAITIDDTFTSATKAAVERWQKAHGYEEDGVVVLGQVIFLAGPTRIGAHRSEVGALVRSGTAVTEVTITETVDTVFSPRKGVVTDMAARGTPVEAGTTLFAIDARPTIAVTGSGAFARELKAGVSDGEDVAVLEVNLVALGHDPDKAIVVDDHFDKATTDAVKRLQLSLGVPQDGVLAVGSLVVVPEGLTVGKAYVSIGGGSAIPAGTPVLDLVASHRQVIADVSVNDRSSLKVGDPVKVEFPDDSRKDGRIEEISSVATVKTNQAVSTATVPVTVTLLGDDFDPNLVSTPVDVLFVDRSVTGVLAVPTGALVALKEGGFAVQIQDGSANKLVGVKAGLYSDSWVEVSGAGIAEGTTVLVAS